MFAHPVGIAVVEGFGWGGHLICLILNYFNLVSTENAIFGTNPSAAAAKNWRRPRARRDLA
jgi:hypothetical protein